MAALCRRCGVSDVQSGFLRGWRGRVYPHADAWRLGVGDALSRTCSRDSYAGSEVASTRMLTHGGSVSAMRCLGRAVGILTRVARSRPTRMLTHGGFVSAMRCLGYAFVRD